MPTRKKSIGSFADRTTKSENELSVTCAFADCTGSAASECRALQTVVPNLLKIAGLNEKDASARIVSLMKPQTSRFQGLKIIGVVVIRFLQKLVSMSE